MGGALVARRSPMSRLDRRPAQLPLTLRRRAAVPLQQQIVQQVHQLVQRGILAAGARLPSTRALAEQLDVSRNTVAIAYELLIGEGLIEVERYRGASVSRRLPAAFSPGAARPREGASGASGARPLVRPAIPALDLHAGQALAHDFRLGQVDDRLFPAQAFRRSVARQAGARAPSLARYGDPAGLESLRASVADHLRRARGIVCSPERVVIVAGCQEGLNLIARVLLKAGSEVVVENPCYRGAAAVFRSHGARLRFTPVDDEGLVVGALDGARPALAYVTPSHQFPLGCTLSLDRRLQLLDWAARTGAYVVEDDYDSDFRYEGSPLLALEALDARGSVIYLGTFSKSIGAGLRLGYAVFPESLAGAAVAAKSIMNNGHSAFDQAVVAELLSGGAFDQHLRRIRHQYLARRDALLRSIERHFGPCRVDGIEGGMHVAWHLPEHLPCAEPLCALARQHGVGLYGLSAAPVATEGDLPGADWMVFLGYPCLEPERIARAIEVLAAALRGARRPAPPGTLGELVNERERARDRHHLNRTRRANLTR